MKFFKYINESELSESAAIDIIKKDCSKFISETRKIKFPFYRGIDFEHNEIFYTDFDLNGYDDIYYESKIFLYSNTIIKKKIFSNRKFKGTSNDPIFKKKYYRFL